MTGFSGLGTPDQIVPMVLRREMVPRREADLMLQGCEELDRT